MIDIKPGRIHNLKAYQRGRPLIATGDLISIKKRGVLWSFFSLFLGREYPNHSAIAYVTEGTVWCAEMVSSGNRMVRLSTYVEKLGKSCDWVEIAQCPAHGLSKKLRIKYIELCMKSGIKYSYLSVILAGLERITNGWLEASTATSRSICSRFVFDCYRRMGVTLPAPSGIIDPRELSELVSRFNAFRKVET